MLRILTSLALFHWAALFSLLTALCVFSDLDRVALALGGSGEAGSTSSLSPLNWVFWRWDSLYARACSSGPR